jgi:Kae1-associated kinase Bud32
MARIIGRGAEAILYLDKGNLVKKRIKKGYRHNSLDFKIRKSCTRKEYRLMSKASKFIDVPKIFDFCDVGMEIVMEFINGETIRDVLDSFSKNKRNKICNQIGENVALLHNNGIIHGDLTTSNFILKDDKIYFIDFGLGFFSNKVEDKAVDLHLLRQALESKHYKYFEDCFKEVLKSYKKKSDDFSRIIERFGVVEKRGRYKRKKK